MNYGKKGISKIQKSLTSKKIKLKKMVVVTTLKLLIIAALSTVVIGVCLGLGIFKGILSSAPDINPASVLPTGYATVVYDAKGNDIAKLVAANSNRSYEDMSKIPQHLANAFVAIEDERFYSHNGIDLKSMVRAGFQFIKTKGKSAQGASTITQQLIKNNVFDDWVNENTIQKIKRKIQEQSLAMELEKEMPKEKILEIYMNTINIG